MNRGGNRQWNCDFFKFYEHILIITSFFAISAYNTGEFVARRGIENFCMQATVPRADANRFKGLSPP